MKKVGILTFCYEHNYGAVLQCLALTKKLESYQLDVEVLRYITAKGNNDHLKLISFKSGNLMRQLITAPFNYKKYKRFREFIINNLRLSKPLLNFSEFNKYVKNFDALISGSDQVWNDDITKESKDVFFLNLGIDNVKLYSYAASFGKENLSNSLLSYTRSVLENYNMVSVRENSASRMLSNINIDNKCVLDPTLLFSEKDWKQYECEYKISEDYILVYTMEKNSEVQDLANYISKKLNLKVVHFRKERIFDNELKRVYDAGPGEFLNIFRNAKYVVTNSFHGLVFSIIYGKNFISIPHNTRNTRQENLLEKLELKSRMVKKVEEFRKIENEKIDYNKVYKLLNKNIDKSLDYIKMMVEDINE